MARNRDRQSQKRMLVTVRYVPAVDASARVYRAIGILLKAAEEANSLSGESVAGRIEETPSGQASVEDTATLGSDIDCPVAGDDPNREHC